MAIYRKHDSSLVPFLKLSDAWHKYYGKSGFKSIVAQPRSSIRLVINSITPNNRENIARTRPGLTPHKALQAPTCLATSKIAKAWLRNPEAERPSDCQENKTDYMDAELVRRH